MEFKKKAAEKFRELDGNGNGYLAGAELEALVAFTNEVGGGAGWWSGGWLIFRWWVRVG